MKTKLTTSLLISAGCLLYGSAGAKTGPSSDPTSLSPALREALQAMQSEPEHASRRGEDLTVRLRGRILQVDRKAVILSIGDEFFALREGDTVTHRGRSLILREIGPEAAILNETRSNRVLTLR